MKENIRQIFRRLGFDIVKYYPSAFERAKAIDGQRKGAKILKMLTLHEIDLVLDVGANSGQYARSLLDIGYQGKIISFEPTSSAYEQLVLSSQNNPNWEVAEQCAVGNINGEIEIHISANSESSSVLNILPTHVDAAKKSAYVGSEVVKIYRLDDLVSHRLSYFRSPFLKIDTQGYEDRVLQGSAKIIAQIQGLYLEMSLVPLYEDQVLFEDMLITIKNLGFSLYNLTPGFSDYRTGRLLQVMGTFFRNGIES
ncbi:MULTISPECIES: FkbM family methyltransferase [unclassified Coleofasciculus]|uniref:FkbM family methyltransferase n=1 Tax=unclassified Coleofasciculus TaxID=2692782 RepID=UPI00187E47F4|nr:MULTISPECIES: FkbM family methyltransferase [unclassified Coleofasciculus]MBE9124877.1 FkbM family methyltransferase [Coleofasciculus sp. LEGE 07081]MBE9147879.1 FkbM family methyltransferase [Coleofasciculus sp. LEGE 07092]